MLSLNATARTSFAPTDSGKCSRRRNNGNAVDNTGDAAPPKSQTFCLSLVPAAAQGVTGLQVFRGVDLWRAESKFRLQSAIPGVFKDAPYGV